MYDEPRKGVRLVAAAVKMIDAIRRFFGDFRPADWTTGIIELLFIAVILWLDLPERFHRRRVRNALVIVKELMAEGQGLVRSAPWASTSPDEPTAARWVRDVNTWIEKTHQSFEKNSIQAMMSFEQRALEPDVHFGGMTGQAGAKDQFRELLHRLRNLQNIMEKADVYF